MRDCICRVCRTRLLAMLLTGCPECGLYICPTCSTHGSVLPFGTFVVPPEAVATVRASVWGKAN